MNIQLLRQVQDAIRLYPENFNMDSWRNGDFAMLPNNGPKCGTTACLAGWICELAGKPQLSDLDIPVAALDILSVPEEEIGSCPDEYPLFHAKGWPVEIHDEYMTAELDGDHRGMAEAACKAIDAWIVEQEAVEL